jgi:hypothetical protein
MILFQEKENPDGRGSSSSPDMISFDLSDGNQYPPHLRMALDDDQYVEYQMEDMADFPSNAEEEERVRPKNSYYVYVLLHSHNLITLFRCL